MAALTNEIESDQLRQPDSSEAGSNGRGRFGALRQFLTQDRLIAALLIAVTFAAYWPCWYGTWVWDDQVHLLNNPVLRPGGLAKVWIPGGYLNYWPITYTVYWLEFQLWGLQPLGYHLVNLTFHCVAALLVWRVLTRMQLPGAWLAAAIFALHPINVESVAWVAQLKGIISLVFGLLSLLCYLSFERKSGRWRYALALAMFVLSALAKGELLTLPIVLLALAWWQRGRIVRRDVLLVAPYFAIAACLAGAEIWFERVVGSGAVRTDGIVSRIAVAGCAVWLYLWKLIWPWDLLPFYPRWSIPLHGIVALLPALALVTVFAVAWQYRRAWGQPVLMTLVCYLALLLPVLGFVDIAYMKFSLVADHWQYAAMIVICAAFAAASANVVKAVNHRGLIWAGGIALLAVFTVLTWRQSCVYASSDSFYETVLAENHASFAENNYGAVLGDRGDIDAAASHYQRAVAIDPDNAEANSNLAQILLSRGDIAGALAHLDRALQIDPDYPEAHCILGAALAKQGDFDAALKQFNRALERNPELRWANFNLAQAYASRGEFDVAMPYLQRELEIEPGFKPAEVVLASVRADRAGLVNAMHDLLTQIDRQPNDPKLLCFASWILATNPNASIRDGHKAVELAERAWKITGGGDLSALTSLAAAYAEVGRFSDAILADQQALRLTEDKASNDECRRQIESYKHSKPWRQYLRR